MIRYLILAGDKQEYYAYLRANNIGWIEAVYINHPTMLNGQTAPVLRIGTWRKQPSELKKAVKKYEKKLVFSQE